LQKELSAMLNLTVTFQSTISRAVTRAQDEDGQTLAEYGLIMAVISVAIVIAALLAFRGAITTAFNNATGCLDGTC
jgi:Flp pilus assembly pilin Flp